MEVNGTTKKSATTISVDASSSIARNALFNNLKREALARNVERPKQQITVEYHPKCNNPKRTLGGTSWHTTPLSIARQVALRSQLDRWVVARVNGEIWDLEQPLEKDSVIQFLEFDDREGKEVFWRSCAHILGNAAAQRFGGVLSFAQVRDDGFMHEWGSTQGTGVAARPVTKADYKPLHLLSHKVINKALPFERLWVGKPDLQQMFSDNKYKLHTIDQLGQDETLLVYRCGTHIDICSGPLLTNTSKIKAFELSSNSSSYFLADANNDNLQRLYGVGFPTRELLEEHKKWVEEASQRDHRKVGKEQELFFFHSTISPGSAFFLPAGQRIYNTLMAYIRDEYWTRGYQEVTTPNMFNSTLWKQSGHWEHYRDDMFRFDVEKDEWALKPMNCPGHCVLFGHRERTYRELPFRVSEFGVLHRNELSGALTGLTRVRRFVQDDSHIFCTQEQVGKEVKDVLDWLTDIYHRLFGFTLKIKLSTMPEKHLGDEATWQRAEAQLTVALNTLKDEMGINWEINAGDGAFYGPKIDIAICDALKREHQCATIQLDFQLPQQFNLEYRTDEQPLMRTQPTKDTNQDVTNGDTVLSTTEADAMVKNPKQTSEPVNMANHVNGTDHQANVEKQTEAFRRRELTPGFARPVMIHRSILGSFERFIAILCEHLAGNWPFWLSPRQILIVPVTAAVNDYAVEVQRVFRARKMHVDVDLSRNTISKKIRAGQMWKYNFIFVVGRKERDEKAVNIRNREDPSTHKRGEVVQIERALKLLSELRDERRLKGLFGS